MTVRTINEIFTQLLVEKVNFTTLNGLTTTVVDEQTLIDDLNNGAAAEWVIWLYNQAVAIHLAELRLSDGVTELQTITANNYIATPKWYIDQVLAFQYGDTLTIDTVTYQSTYTTIDEAKKIIASCTLKTLSNKLYLKVRRKNTSLLSNDEKTALTTYLNQKKIAGTTIVLEN